eukprot:s1196_g7.t2
MQCAQCAVTETQLQGGFFFPDSLCFLAASLYFLARPVQKIPTQLKLGSTAARRKFGLHLNLTSSTQKKSTRYLYGPCPSRKILFGDPTGPGCMGLLTLISTVFFIAPLVESLCFSDGIPESDRVNLTNSDGESYPVGIWVPSWAAGVSTSAVMQVLVEEKLGFQTVIGGGPATVDGFFAIAGCESPTDMSDRGCGSKHTYYHVHLEGWTAGYTSIWNQIQQDYPDTAPQNLGSMGYSGVSGPYISREVIESAYDQEGLALEFYRTHNASKHLGRVQGCVVRILWSLDGAVVGAIEFDSVFDLACS